MHTVAEDDDVRLLRLRGWIMEEGKREDAHFICTTERFGRTRVLGLDRFSPALLD